MFANYAMEYGLALAIGGAGFAIFAIRLLIMEYRGYKPRHSVHYNIPYVGPDYHPDHKECNIEEYSWFDATVKRGKYGHAEPIYSLTKRIEKKRELRELQARVILREHYKNWQWLNVPYQEWAGLWPDRKLALAGV